MNAQATLRLSIDEYLLADEAAELPLEYLDAQVFLIEAPNPVAFSDHR
ncbi:MAG: hypothetical protein HY820_19340 [Acidobacteria bacterium]|nr:hypothetical protein [Acidobacteriota bacterium]